MIELWSQWKPIQELSLKYYIISTVYDCNGLKIFLGDDLDDEGKSVLITFKHGVSTYRLTDESFRLETIAMLSKNYGVDFYGYWTFFTITKSTYVKWLLDESLGHFSEENFLHFTIVTSDLIFDVIATYEPSIEFID